MKSELAPNVRNLKYMEFQNNQHGLRGKIRRSLQDSQPNYTLSSFIVFFNSSGWATAANQISACTLRMKWV